MDEKELAFEISKKVIELEAENEALRRILKRSWPPTGDPWPLFVEKGKGQVLALEITQQRYDQLQTAFAAASGGDSLIRTLHNEIVNRKQIPLD